MNSRDYIIHIDKYLSIIELISDTRRILEELGEIILSEYPIYPTFSP